MANNYDLQILKFSLIYPFVKSFVVKRRSFIQKGTLAGGAALVSNKLTANTFTADAAQTFKMKYAPHLGMFKHHAGEDPIDQLNFMADMGTLHH